MEPDQAIYATAIADLLAAYRTGGNLKDQQFADWGNGDYPVAQAIDFVGLHLALDYAIGALSWDFCDFAANTIDAHRLWAFGRTGEQAIFTGDFDEFYQAFDASELEKPEVRAASALRCIEAFLDGKGFEIRR